MGTPNRLLKAVLEDAINVNYIAGCKALGLLNKQASMDNFRV